MTDKPDYGKGSTPGHFCVLPQRAVIDLRFKQHPAVFRVLAALGNYTSRQGVCWPNQATIARDLHLCQSTVSRHIKKLIEWDYIRYAKKHPGLKGNKYFMVFDPEIKEADAVAIATVQDRSFEEKPEVPKGALGEKPKSVDKIVDNLKGDRKPNKADIHSDTYSDMQSEYIHNNITNNEYIPLGKSIMNKFVRMSEELYGQIRVFDERHVEIVAGWLQSGIKAEYIIKRIRDIMVWRRGQGLDSPKSIQFFKDAIIRPKKESRKDRATEMLKKLGRSMKYKR